MDFEVRMGGRKYPCPDIKLRFSAKKPSLSVCTTTVQLSCSLIIVLHRSFNLESVL